MTQSVVLVLAFWVQSVSPERAQVVTLSAIADAVVSAGRSDFRSVYTLSFIVFDFVPLSASFTFTCLSKKFVRLSLNKFDKALPAYGFGFSSPNEKDLFCTQLDRIRSYAKSTLTPTFRMTSLEMGSLSIRSPSSTPPRPCLPNMYSDTPRRDYYGPSTPAYSPLPPPSSFEYTSSPYKQQPPLWSNYTRPPFYSQPPPTPPYMNSFEVPYQSDISYDYSLREDRTPRHKYDAPDLSKASLPIPGLPLLPLSREPSPDRPFTNVPNSPDRPASVCSKKPIHEAASPPEDKVAIAERRVRALMDSIQPVGSFWDSPADVSADARSTITLPRAASRSENPAGVIGSPVKGKGGAPASRHQTPKRTWKWQ
ncbi:hypothetical protein Y032_0259g479 [Ancylostoma ceylanicum]|uniref:WH1 domain-containing protein n=1 Tax=Ancylostoma ceylanicum TaxID=53326 RepID=A0A016SAH4_9BILA|nr:hypothetical protein Y032_0259g479 [Ancylostoma ceylanicum]